MCSRLRETFCPPLRPAAAWPSGSPCQPRPPVLWLSPCSGVGALPCFPSFSWAVNEDILDEFAIPTLLSLRSGPLLSALERSRTETVALTFRFSFHIASFSVLHGRFHRP